MGWTICYHTSLPTRCSWNSKSTWWPDIQGQWPTVKALCGRNFWWADNRIHPMNGPNVPRLSMCWVRLKTLNLALIGRQPNFCFIVVKLLVVDDYLYYFVMIGNTWYLLVAISVGTSYFKLGGVPLSLFCLVLISFSSDILPSLPMFFLLILICSLYWGQYCSSWGVGLYIILLWLYKENHHLVNMYSR